MLLDRSGDKWASKVALFFGLAAFASAICLLSQNNLGHEINYSQLWIAKPKIFFALKADGLALAMLLLTTALTPILIFSSFGNTYKNAKSFYALLLFMIFAMVGNPLSHLLFPLQHLLRRSKYRKTQKRKLSERYVFMTTNRMGVALR